MKIDKKIPIPGVLDARSIATKMRRGDSVLLKDHKEGHYFRYYVDICEGFKAVGRAEKKGYRIWKVKA